jgi:hypothetical protein
MSIHSSLLLAAFLNGKMPKNEKEKDGKEDRRKTGGGRSNLKIHGRNEMRMDEQKGVKG